MPIKMHSNMRQLFSAFAFKAFGSLFALFVLAHSSVHAAGLGKLTVLSSLGHPLRAEIELTAVAKDEGDSIVVKLASPDLFKQANLDFNTALYSLSFVVEKRGERYFVRVSSGDALNEPFIGMLLELRSNSGRITREYTFLLDPAELRTTTPAVAATPARVQPVETAKTDKPAETAKIDKPVETAQIDKPVPVDPHKAIAPVPLVAPAAKTDQIAADGKPTAPQTSEAVKAAPATPEKVEAEEEEEEDQKIAEEKPAVQKAAEHKVKKGDMLAVIAKQYKYEDVSLEQMLVSIYRANPEAFIAKNMNRLRVGRVLKLPEEEAASGLSKVEARKVIVAHSSDYAAYRNKLAERAAQSAAQRADATQVAGGRITAEVQDKTGAARTAQDKLKLSKAAQGVLAADKSSAGLSAEEQAAAAKAIADERARVRDLEKNVSDLQRLLELKNQELAAQQKHATNATAAKRAADAAAAKMAADKIAADKLAALRATADKAAADKAAADKAAADKLAAERALAATTAKGAPPPAASVKPPLASAPGASVSGAPVPPMATPGVKKPIKRVAPPPMPAQMNFFDEMMNYVQDNMMIVAGGGGIIVLLLAYIFVRRRSKKKSLAPLGGSLVGDAREYQNSLFGSAGGQSVDTNNSIFNSGFTPSASLLDANEVDPVAEADVYIAYGREAQAIEILKEALRSHPERNALRVKLLEIYASQKEVQAFDLLAGELYGLTRGEGEEWIYAAGLGMAIDPTNPLYAGGDMSEELLNRPTSLQGSMTQPRQESEPDAMMKKQGKKPETLGYEFVQPAREQIEKPDLSLDLGGSPPSQKSAAAAMDFDMGLSSPKAKSAASSGTMGFDLGDLDAKKDLPSTKGMTVSETSTMDFGGIELVSPSGASAEDREFQAKMAAADRELAAIDKVEPYSPTPVDTMKTSQPQSGKTAPSMDFDFGSINLNLAAPKQESKPAASTPAPAPASAPATPPQRSSVPVDSAEMDTKIELAAAYYGIGDKEGARELLDEVILDGTPEQIQKAKESLAKFA